MILVCDVDNVNVVFFLIKGKVIRNWKIVCLMTACLLNIKVYIDDVLQHVVK